MKFDIFVLTIILILSNFISIAAGIEITEADKVLFY